MKTFLHSGDAGDLIYALPSIKTAGGGILYGCDRNWTAPFINRIPLLKRLSESQDYITVFHAHSGEKIDHDFSTFRNGGLPYGVNLATLHAKWTRIPANVNEKWLAVSPDLRTEGKIVIHRSPRYRNPFFPWKQIVETFRDDIVMVGLPEEHRDFVESFGQVDYQPTNDLYEVACLIEGSELYIGNQSSPMAICEGLKHRSIQEVCLWVPDCLYSRDNATYCYDGSLTFSACGKEFTSQVYEPERHVNRHETPSGGWRFKFGSRYITHHSIPALIAIVQQYSNMSKEQIESQIISDTIEQVPTLGVPKWTVEALDSVQRVRSLVEAL